jgi:hypothetical protein
MARGLQEACLLENNDHIEYHLSVDFHKLVGIGGIAFIHLSTLSPSTIEIPYTLLKRHIRQLNPPSHHLMQKIQYSNGATIHFLHRSFSRLS